MDRILLVRLGALGDIIHALPVAAALREACPSARIDWLVSSRHQAILDYVTGLDRRIVLPRKGDGTGRSSLVHTITRLREAEYDVALDLQGLMKSAVLARSSGARRVIGFATPHLRERWAHLFYTETVEPPAGVHVVDKNLALLQALGLSDLPKRFPLVVPESECVAEVLKWGREGFHNSAPNNYENVSGRLGPGARLRADDGENRATARQVCRFALINPGAGWPNKRWPPEWFGAVAGWMRDTYQMPSVVLWGPGEEPLARAVVDLSHGAAHMAPPTGIPDLIALARAASLFISGDTGPLHIAAALGTPIVGIYGPTSPSRNGPWDPSDVSVSRFGVCQCHHRRRCRLSVCCLLDITVDDVKEAVERRLR